MVNMANNDDFKLFDRCSGFEMHVI
jgi:hypothetical protein